MKTWHRALYALFLATLCIGLAHTLKISYIWGSQAAFFSLANGLWPLLGLFGGLPGAFLYLLFFIVKACFHDFSWLNPLVFRLPTFCAALYWAKTSWLIRLGIPLVCMILFVTHPIGSQAAFYALFWLIPMVIYFISHQSIFLHALASTFVAHAVGSVLWLYWIPMKPEIFAALVPLVIVERLVFATGMTLVYYMVNLLKDLLQALSSYKFFTKSFVK